MTRPLDVLAQRAATDSAFLGYALDLYAASDGLDDAALARRLGCATEHLTRLRLCLRPRAEPEHFWSDVEEIAGFLGVDGVAAAVLADAVRRADAIAALRAAAGVPRYLAAARDREPEDATDPASLDDQP